MKYTHYLSKIIGFILVSFSAFSQHQVEMSIVVDVTTKTLTVNQKIEFFNQTNDSLSAVFLNDWNHAFSSKKTALAKRFSDEFIRTFQVSNASEQGSTEIVSIKNDIGENIIFQRLENNIDLVELKFDKKIAPNQKRSFNISYKVKIPSAKFSNYGFNENGNWCLKDWFLGISRYENGNFVKNSNVNIDDISNGISDYKVKIDLPDDLQLTSDLNVVSNDNNSYVLEGKSRTSFNLFLQKRNNFSIFKNSIVAVHTNLTESKIDDIQKALIINKIVEFTNENLGKYTYDKITISKEDYDRNPFYGLNQLPRFLNPFQNDFIFELKFLKTYLNTFLKTSLHLNPRKDNYIYDGIQVFLMMKYIDENYPNSKMMGSIAKFKILKSFHLINLDFNEQYSYFYILTARSNLDQAIGDSKEALIKFNEKIAGKYRAGLSFKYLDSYLENDILIKSIRQLIEKNQNKQSTNIDFETVLKNNSPKNIKWFFETIVNSRKIIDFKITDYNLKNDSVSFTVKNKTGTVVPIPVYGLNGKEIVFKKWLDEIKTDSVFRMNNRNVSKLVLNYRNEVPEFNLRNNFKKIEGFFPNNRPIKFVFMKDLEDPRYNQILYVPAFNFNLYDGFIAGMRFHNSTMLAKNFYFDIEPLYGIKSKSLTGSFSFLYNQILRNSNLFNIRYGIFGSTFSYAQDAKYTKFNPVVSASFRNNDLRDNEREYIMLRYITVNREKSAFVITKNSENYSVLNARFGGGKNELTKQFNYMTDFQIAENFSKASAIIKYRKMFDDNRQINFRFFGGFFLQNNTKNDFFSFALDRPTDYLFDYDFIGRSESSGIFSQQLVIAEGGFKTKVKDSYANQWITSVNVSGSIWNWVEVYGDAAIYKNTISNSKFIYDSGIRLNFVPDYFELYFPIYSSNGWNIDENYGQKIRFSVTISTNTLISLFTRKWF